MTSRGYHTPVLLHDCIDGLAIDPNGTYVDVTFGGGGHSRQILEHLDGGHLYAFDQDLDASQNVPDDSRFTFVRQNFRFMQNHLRLNKVKQVDGILADLGVSSHQFDEAQRGFSTRMDADLDMRMDRDISLRADTVLNTYSEEDLYRIFNEGADLKRTRGLVEVIQETRPHKTTAGLREKIERLAPHKKKAQFMAQVFQAVRIEVNDELVALKELLLQSVQVLKPGGRLVVMSYHSIEDRLVKNFIRTGKFSGEVEKDFFGNPIKPLNAINRKVIMPSEQEIETNNRARSARLRIAERLNEQEEKNTKATL
jgi:16S rRNA (cytosine1402-N4)-methyltransferase